MMINSGFVGSPPQDKTTQPNERFVGLFYYDPRMRAWDRVLDVVDGFWIVQRVSENGKPIGPIRKHVSPLWANRFADKPFRVNRSNLLAA